jgi:GTP-binding protein
VHLLDVFPEDGSDPVENYKTIRSELERYSPELAAKEEMIVFNKIDLLPEEELDEYVGEFATRLGIDEPLMCSGATHAGIRSVLERCWSMVNKQPASGW